MQEHIGKILQEKLNEAGMPTVKDFAELIGLSTRTLYNVFNGNSDLTMQQIIRASEILKFDLISEYLKARDKLYILSEPAVHYSSKRKPMTVSVHLSADVSDMNKFPELVKEIGTLALRMGFRLT